MVTPDTVAFIRARLDEQEREFSQGHEPGECHPNCGHVCMLRGVEAKRRIVDEHAPILNSVEWPHDQTGKGEAWICRRCANAENDQDNWRPAIGHAGTFPHENFVTSYVLAPCPTLRLLASEFADHPDYRQEWTP